MKKFALLITYIYVFCCPLEFVLNRYFGSSVKLIAAAAVIVTAFYFLIEQKITIKFTAFQFCLLGWAGLEALSILWTDVTRQTHSMLLSYIMMAAFIILLSFFPFDKKESDRLIMFYSLGTMVLVIMLITMGQVDGSAHTGRMTIRVLGKNQDPNGLAALILSGAFYSLYKTLEAKRLRILYFAAFLVQSFGVVYTGSRGGLVAYVVALVTFLVIKMPKKGRIPAILSSLVLIVGGYFVLEALLPRGLFNRLFNISAYFSSGGMGRTKIWMTGLQELMKSPVIGHGTTSHLYYFSQTLGGTLAMHNTFLCVAFEVGIIGLVLFVIPFISTFFKALKHKNALIASVLVANVTAAFFLDSLYLRFLWNALIFAIVYKNSLESEQKQELVKEKKA